MRHLRVSRSLRIWSPILVVFLIVAMGASSCGGNDAGTDQNRRDAVEHRENVFNAAESAVPVPQINSFPLRQALADFMVRQSLTNHPWYIYILAPMTGEPIGYFVAKTYPISTCNFLSSSERFVDLPDAQWGQVTAPSYDGMFYGGGGSSAACQSMFFEDLATGAFLVYNADLMISSDVPMPLLSTRQLSPDADAATPEAG